MKNWLISAATILAGLLASPQLFAASADVEARGWTQYCGYYSNGMADIRVTYSNGDLPWGSKVELLYGAAGYTVRGGGSDVRYERYSWRQEKLVTMNAVAGYTWQLTERLVTSTRSLPSFTDGVNFVFKITYPDGHVAWDNGGDSAWGFFAADFSEIRANCVHDAERPEFRHVAIKRVHRN